MSQCLFHLWIPLKKTAESYNIMYMWVVYPLSSAARRTEYVTTIDTAAPVMHFSSCFSYNISLYMRLCHISFAWRSLNKMCTLKWSFYSFLESRIKSNTVFGGAGGSTSAAVSRTCTVSPAGSTLRSGVLHFECVLAVNNWCGCWKHIKAPLSSSKQPQQSDAARHGRKYSFLHESCMLWKQNGCSMKL